MDDAAIAMMMADLGVARRDMISATDENSNCMTAQQERAIHAAADDHRARALEGKTDVAKWNVVSNFKADPVTAGLEDRYAGQGHRAALQQKTRNSPQTAHSYNTSKPFEGISRPPRNHRAANFSPGQRPRREIGNNARQRAPSPRSFGTVRIVKGSRAGIDSQGLLQRQQAEMIKKFASQQAVSKEGASAGVSTYSPPLPSPESLPSTSEQEPTPLQQVPTPLPAETNAACAAPLNPEPDTTPQQKETKLYRGRLSARFFSYVGQFLGNVLFPIEAPILANVDIHAKAVGYDPRQLADDLEAVAKEMLDLTNNQWPGAGM